MQEESVFTRPDLADSPARFAEAALGLTPTDQQREFLEAVAKPGARVAVRSGHGTGKSTSLAVAALWFLATRPDGLVPCTAPTSHQLQDVLWRELRRLIGRLPDEARALFQVTADRVQRKGATGMIVARTARPENPDALQGFHAEHILFIIDEAAGVSDAIFEVARGALSTPSARVALTGNPTRLSGYFHNAFHGARDSWTRLVFSCLGSPLVAPEYARDIAREYGEDSDMYRVRVLGEFPRTGMFNLISLELVDQAMARAMPENFQDREPLVYGVDPAWLGMDRSAIVARRGLSARVVAATRGLDTVRLTELVARRAESDCPDAIFVDQTGVGAGVLDQLKRTSHNVIGVSFAHTPHEPDRFANKRAELWWRLRDWLHQGPVLEKNDDLRDDLIKPEYSLNGSGKIQLESKDDMRKRGLASPDLADALARTFSLPVRRRDGSPAVVMAADSQRPYEWMERNNEWEHSEV
ncbi:MAG: DEAD/DEAH box helicase family protein [Planctomycetes bacterium]|nr:DEAD/DEAH box helicase family protein [Planctomycetota bacterium]